MIRSLNNVNMAIVPKLIYTFNLSHLTDFFARLNELILNSHGNSRDLEQPILKRKPRGTHNSQFQNFLHAT